STHDGPAAAAFTRGSVGGSGKRRISVRESQKKAVRRFHWHLRERLLASPVESSRSRLHRRLQRDGQFSRSWRRQTLVSPRSARPLYWSRHGMFFVIGRCPSGLPQSSQQGVSVRHRRRRKSDSSTRAHDQSVEGSNVSRRRQV